LLASRKINDTQPAHRQRNPWRARIVHQEPFPVRSAMLHGCCHRANARFRFAASVQECDATNSAHAVI
jgi:hypothetical protein